MIRHNFSIEESDNLFSTTLLAVLLKKIVTTDFVLDDDGKTPCRCVHIVNGEPILSLDLYT